MKIKVISRSEVANTKERSGDVRKVFRNRDPALHPHERSREVTRAVNSVKLDRMFSKPFLFSLDGHMDSVTCLARSPKSLSCCVSGAADGEIKVWHLANRRVVCCMPSAHTGFVRGVSVTPDGRRFVSCGVDRLIKIWKLDMESDWIEDAEECLDTIVAPNVFNALDHHWNGEIFATASSVVDVWSHNRHDPIHSFAWGADSIDCVRFNPVETDVVASCASDRNIVLYDIRAATPIKKIIMEMRTNSISWNPMEAMNFVAANEDHNVYAFDMRKMQKASNIYKDHVAAVMDVDFSPTGQELVTGSYDRTLRIFNTHEGHSREIYHTKRMQRIFCVKFSGDARYVLSGSDDTNIRVWKAQASRPLGVMAPRQKKHYEYREKLVERYQHIPLIGKMKRHRIVPKAIKNAKYTKHVMMQSRREKERRRRAHTAKGTHRWKDERAKHIVQEED